jgi:hypothetical protein
LLNVERVQVRVEVLLRAVDTLLGTFLLPRRTVARQLAEVGECGEQRELLVPELGVVLRELVTEL